MKNKHYLRPQLDVYNGKNHNKIKLASDKNETKQFNLYFIRQKRGPVLDATG